MGMLYKIVALREVGVTWPFCGNDFTCSSLTSTDPLILGIIVGTMWLAFIVQFPTKLLFHVVYRWTVTPDILIACIWAMLVQWGKCGGKHTCHLDVGVYDRHYLYFCFRESSPWFTVEVVVFRIVNHVQYNGKIEICLSALHFMELYFHLHRYLFNH